MPRITLDATASSPQAAVAPRLLTVLTGYASRDDFTLTVDLGPAGAAMSVPVTVELGDYRTRTATVVPLTMQARHHAAWFPTFRGAVRNEDGGPLESILRLDGTYEVPLGPLGAIVDRVVLGSAAEQSLHAFLDRVRSDVLEEVRRAELNLRRRRG